MSKKIFGENEKIDVEDIGYNNVYTQRQKKREKIVIHNVDGTTEELNTGIVFTIEDVKDKKGLRIVAKHCNTKELKEAYVYGLAQVVMAMLESDDEKEKMFHE